MANIEDQNTPNADFSQSIDGAGDGDDGAPAGGAQDAEMSSKINDAQRLAGDASKVTTIQNVQMPDESTLVGRLERKLAAISEVLWEKEGMQMRYTLGDDICEEYYRRWKTEGNSFLILAARLKRRLERERANARKKPA